MTQGRPGLLGPAFCQVCLLQKVGQVKKFMRIAPLFETREDLINAPKVVDAVLSVPWYKNHIQGKQEVQRCSASIS